MIRWLREWQLRRVERQITDLYTTEVVAHARHWDQDCDDCQTIRTRYWELQDRLTWLEQKLWTTSARAVLG